MENKFSQTQTQTQTQQTVQRLSQQQMLQVKLLEMPITQLEQRVESELADNPALEPESYDDNHHDNMGEEPSNIDMGIDETEEQSDEREQREEELERVLDNIDRDDRMESDDHYPGARSEGIDEQIWREETSFYDTLREQAGEYDLTGTIVGTVSKKAVITGKTTVRAPSPAQQIRFRICIRSTIMHAKIPQHRMEKMPLYSGML